MANRAKELALELRQGELSLAKSITEHIVTAENAVEKESVSLRHDVLSPCHDRDFRTIGHLVLPGSGSPPCLTIRVFTLTGQAREYMVVKSAVKPIQKTPILSTCWHINNTCVGWDRPT